jgi:integrase/recombinase XerD
MSTVTKASVYSRTEDTPDTPSLASIDRFLDAVWMERGLSPNTLSAYRADLTALDRWLQTRGSSSLAAKRADVLAFIAFRVEAGARPRSTARQLSSFRRYYRYLIREGAIKEDPTAQIAMPKIGRSLPKSLTEEEVEALLAGAGDGRSARQSRPLDARSAVCDRACACRSW